MIQIDKEMNLINKLINNNKIIFHYSNYVMNDNKLFKIILLKLF